MGLPKHGRITGLCVLAIAALLMTCPCFVGYSVANPYYINGEVPPDQETYPPVITVASPINYTVYNTSRMSLSFNVSAPQSKTGSSLTVIRVTYETDWQNEAIDVLQGSQEQPSFNLHLSNIPEGQHSVMIKAVGHGIYVNEKELSYKEFRISSTTVVSFTIDRTAPTVFILPPENVSTTSVIPLSFTVNEAYSKITYCLNGQPNITVGGNSTLPNLPAGQYNVTFYVWDIAGNMGTSETANFTVAEIPQIAGTADGLFLLLVAAILSTVVIIGIVLLFKRRPFSSR